MLLVLGRPGSGCTTFLKALSGDTHGIFIGDESDVNYEGISYKRMHRDFKGESIYLAEVDVHFPELTLGQTLKFAASTREFGLQRETNSRATGHDLSILFNINNAFDTYMGNAMIRGVSGGEKRRTSIAEAFTSGAQLQFWDNSTRGLDSTTALRFIELLRISTTTLKTTLALSIYQASESMYSKFDKVTLLYEGRQIYFGPVESAAHYFHELGFERPSRATTPDFLTSLTSPDERIPREGFKDNVPRSPDDFASAWKQSDLARQLSADIQVFNLLHPPLAEQPTTPDAIFEWNDQLNHRTSTYLVPIHLQIMICLQRGLQRLRNLPGPVIGSIIANGILALVIGSVYYNLPQTSDSMDRRALLIFLSLLLTALSPSFEVLTIWSQRPIVEKHDRYAFYHPFTDAAAAMICDLPNKILTAILFQVTLYFMTNLRRTPAAFFIWLLFNFVLVLNMSMWFRFIGSISRTMEQTTAPTCILVLLAVIYAGFVVPVPYMVGWLQWFRRANPIAYAYESLMINEMIPEGPSYNATDFEGKICPVVGSVVGQPYVEGNAYLSEKYTYQPVHLWRNIAIMIAMTIIMCAFHLLAAQYIPAQRSKGDMISFQRHNRKRRVPLDSENAIPLTYFRDPSGQVREPKSLQGQAESTPTAIQKQSSIFHWKNLSYEINPHKGTKKILNGIDGWGVTGAGKTTLLDVLADRASFGTTTGDICIDGVLRDASFQRKIGYAQQEDIHLPTATVREALQFSAILRQTNNASNEDKISYVNNVIDILDMTSFADAIVGVPGNDEPTSGLDSQTAWSICVLLRKLADNGQAVLCTIHQPSSQLFRMFDRILLLSDHGETIYFGDIGPNASTLTSYFEREGATKCEPDANPAEWVLDATSAKATAKTGLSFRDTAADSSWAVKWKSSLEKKEVARHLGDINSSSRTIAMEQQHAAYATPWFRQLTTVSTRLFQEYWRNPTYVYSKIALCTGVALFNGLSFENTSLDIQGVTNIIFSMFLLTQMFGTLDQQVIPRIIEGRDLFEAREQRSRSYSWTVFLTSNIVVEVLWQTLATVLVFITWYYPTGLWHNGDPTFSSQNRGALSFVSIWIFCLWIITFSQAVAVGVQNAESAIQLATLMFWFSLVFCGVLVSPADLPGFWIFVYRASPLTYLMGGLISAGLANTNITCSAKETLVMNPPGSFDGTCNSYLAPYYHSAGGLLQNPDALTSCSYCAVSDTNVLLKQLGISTSAGWNNVGYLTVFVVFNVLATFLLYWLARIPRRRKDVSKKAE
ncbi:ZEB2-regulated ABC transporter [Lachnellula suecica]|uniref:ZEB2-regulated ABC transporter n=1 Tax=Lachnellula suecica TaxID=602035 RepID=A0A8T9CNY2_9HELO|nr:ZEB2-regulated ABC transporter [Lachnellula suecica]